jgi:peptidoglycan hydrolase-like protein with peptidoglycan-binding domain
MSLANNWWASVKNWVMKTPLGISAVEYKIWTQAEHAQFASMCKRLNMDPIYLGAVIHFESGFNPASNGGDRSSATGLIQFMGDSKGLYFGMTREQLKSSGVSFQLQKIEARYRNYENMLHGDSWALGWVYCVVALPIAVGMADDYIIVNKDGSNKPYNEKLIYKHNPLWDPLKTGIITPGSLALCIRIHTGGQLWEQWVLEQTGHKCEWPDITGDIQPHLTRLGYVSVQEFQRAHGLVVDGVVGNATRAMLLNQLDSSR